MQPLQLAVLSTSRIVDEFLQHLSDMPEISVQALCCRQQSGEKARDWAQRYGIPAGNFTPWPMKKASCCWKPSPRIICRSMPF